MDAVAFFFTDLCRWRVLDAKSPLPPSRALQHKFLMCLVLSTIYVHSHERRLQLLSTTLHEIDRSGSSDMEKTATCFVHAMRQVRSCQITGFHSSPTRNKNNTTRATSISIEMVATGVAHGRDATCVNVLCFSPAVIEKAHLKVSVRL